MAARPVRQRRDKSAPPPEPSIEYSDCSYVTADGEVELEREPSPPPVHRRHRRPHIPEGAHRHKSSRPAPPSRLQQYWNRFERRQKAFEKFIDNPLCCCCNACYKGSKCACWACIGGAKCAIGTAGCLLMGKFITWVFDGTIGSSAVKLLSVLSTNGTIPR
jgi:hypothetical protein